MGRGRRAALRPGLPARLPADRQPARRRGPHPGGLRPGLPRRCDTYTPGTFEGWLHRITTNLFLDQARRKQRIRFDALSDERADRLTSAGAGARARAYADRTFDDDIEAALATLPPDFRAAVVLCDVEGLTYEEIAEILDAKLGTVRSRIHRGRAMLRKALAHRAPAAGRSRYSGPVAPHPRGAVS